ncbi:MAG: divalent-cation tolerance protein CutA [Gemmatimonadetes bacterium]|nr:divalent-cation tolerance protein CutA [Gemmatimonadota bacterium]NNM04669.1 divalent-cation tolerance protein CutA [Gemmatimonadota bacterium]
MADSPEAASTKVRVVLVTVPTVDSGVILSRRVVEERLAACGNVIPGLTSVYRWDGEIQEDGEALVLFKTTEDALESLKTRVTELHPYEVPEFLAVPVTNGHAPYLRWVEGEVGGTRMPT